MIRIVFERESSCHDIRSVTVEGHAEYDEYGQDIVCAAVSSQIISVENSLTHLLGIEVLVEGLELEGGYLKITLPDQLNNTIAQQAQLLLAHLALAYDVLAENYPEYISIHNIDSSEEV